MKITNSFKVLSTPPVPRDFLKLQPILITLVPLKTSHSLSILL